MIDCTIGLDLVRVWRCYKLMAKWICCIFQHLERGVIQLNDLNSLSALSLVLFHHHLYGNIHPALSALVVKEINRERDGEIIDSQLVSDAVQVNYLSSYSHSPSSLHPSSNLLMNTRFLS
jgi:cullin 1